ncbi:MAG TPA: biopolymer transporter ExbD [Polyangiaceae bacterium]|nr:biopolymer transporter ExbD [Polyangiaceae bacterium]
MAIGIGAGRRGRRKGISEINVTPLVDVMLVLLVVFMVTAPLLAAGLRVDLPEARAEQAELKDSKLVVTITKEGRVLLGEKDVTGAVEGALATDPRVQKEKEVYIRADKDARYGAVASVVAAARSAGVSGLNLLVEQEDAR